MKPMIRRQRDEHGNFTEPRKLESPLAPLTQEEQIVMLGMQLTQEKLAGMQKDALINNLGSQVAQMKLEIMLMKGGGQ